MSVIWCIYIYGIYIYMLCVYIYGMYIYICIYIRCIYIIYNIFIILRYIIYYMDYIQVRSHFLFGMHIHVLSLQMDGFNSRFIKHHQIWIEISIGILESKTSANIKHQLRLQFLTETYQPSFKFLCCYFSSHSMYPPVG